MAQQGPDQLGLLTEKEKEALDLVLDRLTSKQIAKRLGLSPKTIDQRLDSARVKLSAETRVEAACLYASLSSIPERIRYQPIPVSDYRDDRAQGSGVPEGAVYTLGDAGTFRPSAPWAAPSPDWGAPKFRGKPITGVHVSVLILAGAVGLLAVVLLGIGVMQGLNAIVSH